MSNTKIQELLKQHIITILCVISIVAMFLPFAKITAEVSMMGASGGSSQNVTGFAAAQEGILGYLLLVGPAVLIAMNYVKPLEKHKGLLAIAVPAVCLVVLIIVFFQAKGSAVKASGGGFVEVETKVSLGIGMILAGLSYLGTIVAGAVLYHNVTLDKDGLEKLKTEGANLLGNAQEKLTQTVQNVTERVESAKEGHAAEDAGDGVKSVAKKTANLNRTQEVLELIEKLSKMKDAGILSEEEFTEKKRQLLGEI